MWLVFLSWVKADVCRAFLTFLILVLEPVLYAMIMSLHSIIMPHQFTLVPCILEVSFFQKLTKPQFAGYKIFNLCGSSGKEPTWQCRKYKKLRFVPWVEEVPWSRKCNPLQYSCLEYSTEEHGKRLQPMGSQRVGYDWSDLACMYACIIRFLHIILVFKACICDSGLIPGYWINRV